MARPLTIEDKLERMLDEVLRDRKIGVLDKSVRALEIVGKLQELGISGPDLASESETAEEVTYSVGDRFKCPPYEEDWLLTFADTGQVIFVNTVSGLWANGAHKVADQYSITAKEFSNIRCSGMIRTWDSCKKGKC